MLNEKKYVHFLYNIVLIDLNDDVSLRKWDLNKWLITLTNDYNKQVTRTSYRVPAVKNYFIHFYFIAKSCYNL